MSFFVQHCCNTTVDSRWAWGYTFTQELVSKGTIKNLPIFTQELHYGNYLPTYICLFSHRNYKIVTVYYYQIVTVHYYQIVTVYYYQIVTGY